MTTLKRTCAWCGLVLQDGIEPVTHGICQPCLKKTESEENALYDGALKRFKSSAQVKAEIERLQTQEAVNKARIASLRRRRLLLWLELAIGVLAGVAVALAAAKVVLWVGKFW